MCWDTLSASDTPLKNRVQRAALCAAAESDR